MQSAVSRWPWPLATLREWLIAEYLGIAIPRSSRLQLHSQSPPNSKT
ncbi:hypothetical protein [Moorena sp. SIO4G3]|nr:hypothetical protein [Moorena sp. SIO4G3]NEO82275.1 hypothetical protein [Moorena sp. SIO4G3]